MAKRSDDERTKSALTAKLKELSGDKLTQLQKRDVTWYDKRQRDTIAHYTLSALPKGTYCQMAGRAHDVVNKMAKHYRLDPILGDSVDLFDVIESLHDLIAENARLIQPLRTGDGGEEGDIGDLATGEDVYVLQIEKLQQTVKKLKIENARKEIGLKKDRGDAIDRAEVKMMFEWLTTRLQGFGQQLRRSKGGNEAQKSLNEFLDHLSDEIREGSLRV